MAEAALGNLVVGAWFGYKSKIYIKTGVTKREGFCGLNGIVEVYDVMDEMTYNFPNTDIVNTKWWEELVGNKNIPYWILYKAFLEGAKIEYNCLGDWEPVQNPLWYKDIPYRIASPKKHTIKIDGKEIELSEESYKKLKENLL